MKSFKQYLNEGAKDTTAEKYEVAIIMGIFDAQGKTKISTEDLESAQLSSDEVAEVNGNKQMKNSGKKIAKTILKQANIRNPNKVNPVHAGRNPYPLTQFWKEHGGSNNTPKCDFVLQNGSNFKISLKMGPGQLMSGGKGESLATFYAALDMSQRARQTKKMKQLEDLIQQFVERSLTKTPGTVKDLLNKKDKTISAADKLHKKAQSLLQEVFNDDEEFKIAFVKEAMGGKYKFGPESLAAATHVLVATQDGNVDGFNLIDKDEYAKKVADQIRLFVRFKSQSQKIKGKKTGHYNYWSVINLIAGEGEDKEQVENFIKNNNLGVLEEGFFDNVINLIKKVVQYIKNIFDKGWQAILEFFDLGVEDIDTSENKVDFS